MKELLRAAFVIARRDFTAVIFSKAFIFFLLGPLFPVVIGVLAGHLGQDMTGDEKRPVIGVLMTAPDMQALRGAHDRLTSQLGTNALPQLREGAPASSTDAMLNQRKDSVTAVLSGTLEQPVLTGQKGEIRRMEGDISLLISTARAGTTLPEIRLETRAIARSQGVQQQARLLTGRAAQVLLFLLTMLLAGMVLSNLVEEKTNKIIEILAAAVPIDAIFIGKLMAMLAMSLVGISIWGGTALIIYFASFGFTSLLPPPAVGWPVFIALGVIYFAMAYSLLGALFIGIGAQASTVREVQTLSMPVTMGQVVVFFLASYAVNKPGQPAEIVAAIFPLSSPFTMIARAAQSPAIWPHLVAIPWQIFCVGVIIRLGVSLFRRNVLKSGSGKRAKRLPLLKRLAGRASRVQM
ncbi:MAG: ABC transporter permease [Alphaproteobacteria bacterium]|nr:ABC transporter permease [Alphaproteobacteria bacterium]